MAEAIVEICCIGVKARDIVYLDTQQKDLQLLVAGWIWMLALQSFCQSRWCHSVVIRNRELAVPRDMSDVWLAARQLGKRSRSVNVGSPVSEA